VISSISALIVVGERPTSHGPRDPGERPLGSTQPGALNSITDGRRVLVDPTISRIRSRPPQIHRSCRTPATCFRTRYRAVVFVNAFGKLGRVPQGHRGSGLSIRRSSSPTPQLGVRHDAIVLYTIAHPVGKGGVFVVFFCPPPFLFFTPSPPFPPLFVLSLVFSVPASFPLGPMRWWARRTTAGLNVSAGTFMSRRHRPATHPERQRAGPVPERRRGRRHRTMVATGVERLHRHLFSHYSPAAAVRAIAC